MVTSLGENVDDVVDDGADVDANDLLRPAMVSSLRRICSSDIDEPGAASESRDTRRHRWQNLKKTLEFD